MQTGSIRLWQRILAVLCAAAMLLMTFPQTALTAFAAGEDLTLSLEEDKKTGSLTVLATDFVGLADGTTFTVEWKSSNTAAATVQADDADDKQATVTAVGNGTATITATAKYTADGEEKTADKTFSVLVSTPVTAITVSAANTTALDVGGTVQLTASVTPENANESEKTVTWSSDKTEVATVDSNGLVTAVKPGTATITATNSKSVSGTIAITVNKKEPGLTVSLSRNNFQYGEDVVIEYSGASVGGTLVVSEVGASDIEIEKGKATVAANQSGSIAIKGVGATEGATWNWTFTPRDSDYKGVSGSITVVVNKAAVSTVTVGVPTDLTYGGLTGKAITFTAPQAGSIEIKKSETESETVTLTEKPESDPKEYTGSIPVSDLASNAGKLSFSYTFKPADANYADYSGSFEFTIEKKVLTISSITFNEKTYDGETDIDATLATIELSEPSVSVVRGLTYSTEDKDVAYNEQGGTVVEKKVIITADQNGVELSDNDNYTLSLESLDDVSATIKILPKPLTVTGIDFTSRYYNGNEDVSDQINLTYGGKVDGDDVSYGGITASMADAKAGEGKSVTIDTSKAELTGKDAGNYQLQAIGANVTTGKTIDIWKVPLTVKQKTTFTKTSDGTTDVPSKFASEEYYTVEAAKIDANGNTIDNEAVFAREQPYVNAVLEGDKIKGMAYESKLPAENMSVTVDNTFGFTVYIPGKDGAAASQTENYEAQLAEDATISGTIKPKTPTEATLNLTTSENGELELSQDETVAFVPAEHLDGQNKRWFKKDENVQLSQQSIQDGFTLTDAEGEALNPPLTLEEKAGAKLTEIYIKNTNNVVYGPLAITYNYDKEAPTINLSGVTEVKGDGDAGLGATFDASNKALVYTISLSDTLSGLNLKSVQYAVMDNDTDAISAADWKDASATAVSDDKYTITVNVPAKGKYVYVKAQDYAGNEAQKSIEKPLVIENQAPKITEFLVDNVASTDKAANSHTLTVSAKDEGEIFSGIAKVVYEVTQTADADGNALDPVKVVKSEFAVTTHTAVAYDEIKNYTSYPAEGDPEYVTFEGFGDGVYRDGVYSIKVTVYDFCGNSADQTIDGIIIDNTPPTATITMGKSDAASGGNYYYKRGDAGVKIQLADTNMRAGHPLTYTISVDGKPLPGHENATTSDGAIELASSVLEDFDDFNEGSRTLTLAVKDEAGNEATAEQLTFNGMKKNDMSGEVILDFTAPEVSLELTGANRVDDVYYSNANNCGITVTITDTNVAAQGELSSYKVTIDNLEAKELAVEGTTGTLKISADAVKVLQNGEKTIQVTAIDAAGNEAKTMTTNNVSYTNPSMEATFNLDTKAPELLNVDSTDSVDGKIYDEGIYYTLNEGNQVVVTYTIADDAENDNYYDPYTVLTVKKNDTETDEVAITDDHGKVQAVIDITEGVEGDVYSFTIESKDKALNPLVLSGSFEKKDAQQATGDGTIKGSVNKIVDTVAPVATIDFNETDQTSEETHYYEEGNEYRAYYSKAVGKIEATFTVEDANGLDLTKVMVSREGNAPEPIANNSTAPGAGSSKKGLTETSDGDYRFTIYGTDKAGNALTVRENKKTNDKDTDATGSENHGSQETQYVSYPKTLDTEAPTVVIDYTNDPGDAYHYEEKYTYYNENIQVQYTFQDNHGLDENRVYTGYDSTAKTGGEDCTRVGTEVYANNDATRKVVSYKIEADAAGHSTDGHYNFKVYGEDKAGNPLTVTENNTTGPENHTESENRNKNNPYTSSYDKVMDTINPVVTFQVATDADRTALREDNNSRYYFNKDFTATYTIVEENYDGERITAQVGHADPDNYETGAVAADTVFGGKEKVRTYASNGQGIYALSLTGSDRAGNPVVLSGAPSKTLDNNPIQSTDGNVLTSYVMAVDTVAPKLNVAVGNYYAAVLENTGYAVSANQPYRDETSATLSLVGTDRSPLLLEYVLDSSIGNGKTKTDDDVYQINVTDSHNFNGEQVFAVKSLKITDLAGNVSAAPQSVDGNVSNYIYLDVTPPVEDKLAPTVSLVAHESGVGRSTAGVDLYDGTVTVEARIADPGFGEEPHGTGGVSSGLYRLGYKVLHNDSEDWTDQVADKIATSANNTGIETGYVYYTASHQGIDYTSTEQQNEVLIGEDTVVFTFDAATFNYNDVSICVWAEDNTGHKSGEAVYKFGIDTTAPKIEVSYDNNDAQNEKYFKADRVATVVVTERNFNPDATEILTESAASISGWSYAAGGSANGDDDTWTCTVSYTVDGDYTFDIHAKDLVGHDAGEADYGASVAPKEFVIDKTKPVIEITFDNNDVRNGKYYNAVRTATIHIEEHNFSADGADVTTTAGIAEGSVSAPGVGGWSTGGDSNTAQVPFLDDGDYTMHVEYVDLAGNEAEPQDVEEFTVDTTAPELEIGGVEDHMAYNGDVAPSITYHDINYDNTSAGVSITGYKHPEGSNLTGTRSDDAFGGSFVCDNIEVVKENDDVYTATGSVSDLAGNTTEATIVFSVNRFGSTYILSRETQALVDGYYTNTPQTLQVTEINVSTLAEREVTTSLNGEVTTLTEGTDYTVQSSNPGWMQYDYSISASNFEKEGAYTVTLYSEDDAANANTNRAVKENGGKTNELPIDFLVDKTAPVTLITGVEDGKRYVDTERTLVVHYDDNTAMAGLTLYSNDQKVAEYDGEELAKMGGELQYVAKASNQWQTLRVVSVDVAGNQTETISGRFLLTDNLWVQYVNNKPLLFGSILLLILLFILFFLLFKRRKDKEEEQNKQKV